MKILIVEDERITRRSLERQLKQWGHEVVAAEDGEQAWAAYQADAFDAVATDWQMPGLSGCDLVRRIRAATVDRYVYVIMLTSKTEAEDAVEGLDAGADDFLRKPFDQGELRARLNAGERVLRLERAITKQNRRMATDLAAGARYVRSMIPMPITGARPAFDWRYVPATDLAGDTLGYHRIDEGRWALYLLDVTGHGLDAALLSVTILNVVRSMSLPSTDFGAPDQVLATLNNKFPMEEHEDRCFTMWYGVYDARLSSLTWAGGGHPDSLLFSGRGGRREPTRLGSQGPLMGMLPASEFPVGSVQVSSGDRLFLFSDGVYEIDRPGLGQWPMEEFIDFIGANWGEPDVLDRLWRHVQSLGVQAALADDFTILQVTF